MKDIQQFSSSAQPLAALCLIVAAIVTQRINDELSQDSPWLAILTVSLAIAGLLVLLNWLH